MESYVLDFSEDDLYDLDLEIDIEMPETPVTHRSRGRHSYSNRPSYGGKNHGHNADTKNRRRGRSALFHNEHEEDYMDDDDVKDGEADQDPQEKLCESLKPHLTEVSSQRLRCLHMTLRRLGNVDNRISEKDMLLAFQENHVSLTSRLNQLIVEMFGDHQGIDYERLYKCLVSAHNLTGRDSVKARRKRNDLTSRPQMSQEKRDADFLSRIEAQLIRDQTFFDIDTLRAEFQQADTHRTGKVKMEQMMLICQDKTPLYGALLENLLRRCDEDKNETVSWPTLLSFLERGQNSARDRDPELHLLPEKARATAAVNVAPDPIMELSTGARTRLVNSLLRRASRILHTPTAAPR
ncbi:uncharacterized protein [Littorina saxatilis]|uniref:uncharacterized protein n=1 Tax=Littorina saxatilis TaxID=31220 RepID=UPI0038B51B46